MSAERLRTAAVVAAIYAGVAAPLFAFWEIAQLPLYAIWAEQGVSASLWAALHCTLGDVGIAFAAIFAALYSTLLAPGLRTVGAVAAITLLSGLVVAGALEGASVRWLGRWAYSPLMPVAPFLGIGLSPLAQWIVVPAAALFLIRRRLAAATSSWGRAPRPP